MLNKYYMSAMIRRVITLKLFKHSFAADKIFIKLNTTNNLLQELFMFKGTNEILIIKIK